MPWNKYRFKKKESPKAPLSEEEKEKKKNKPGKKPITYLDTLTEIEKRDMRKRGELKSGGKATHGYGKAYLKGGSVK